MSRDLIGLLEAQVQEADSAAEEVGTQREQNHRNYTLQPLGNEQKGRSRYISPDVLDSVEAKKSIFTETFFGGRQLFRFVPAGKMSKEEADQRTAYVNATLRRNNAKRLMRDGWHDAFVAKRMVVYAPWKRDHEVLTIEVQGASESQLFALIQQQTVGERVLDIDDRELQSQQVPVVAPMGPAMPGRQPPVAMVAAAVYTGKLHIAVDRSGVELDLVQPERFFRDPNATYPDESMFCGFERDRSRGKLIEDGYDPEQVMSLKTEHKFRKRAEDTARKQHDGSQGSGIRSGNKAPEQELVVEYTTYTWLDEQTVESARRELAGEQGAEERKESLSATGIRLWKICWAGGEILRYAGEEDGTPGALAIEEVDSMPFFEWCEYKIAHAEHGMADADVLAHTQRVQSTLKRLVIDNQQMRNTSRWEAVHGGIKNPRDLVDNRIGGVIWTRGPGMVKALDTPELSPLTMGVIALLNQDKESRSGMSDLAKGMNSDVIRYQNAADMIERLTNASNRRIMKSAWDFLETFLVPLAKHISMLARELDQRTHILMIQGKPVPVLPSQWSDEEAESDVHPALTKEAALQYAQQLLILDAKLGTSPQLAHLYGPEEQHALISAVFEALGVPDSNRFLLDPSDPQAQQRKQEQTAMQKQAMELQLATARAAAQEALAKAQLAALKIQTTAAEAKLAHDRFQLDAADRAADNLREDRKFEWQKITDTAEYQLELTQGRAASIGDGHVPGNTEKPAGRTNA